MPSDSNVKDSANSLIAQSETGNSIASDSSPYYIGNVSAKSLEEDVCYSPHHRAPDDDAGIDYDALHEYLRTGAIYPTEKHIRKTNSVSNRHLARRDSKGFAGGRPSQSESSRLMFYSKASGVIYAETFQDLYKNANIPESNAPPQNDGNTSKGKSGGDEPHASAFAKLLLGGNFWIDVQAPTEVEMKSLSRIFGIHPLTEEDILMEEDREKCEFFPSYYFVCIRTFDQDHYSPTYMQPILYYMVVMREGILSFHCRQTPHTHNVLKRIEQLKNYIPVTPDWICYALIDDITDSFAPLIRQIDAEVVSIDELVLILKESEQSDMLQRIGHARRNVMAMLRLLIPKPDVIKSLTKRVPSSNDIALYYGDILDHVLSMLGSCNHFESVLGRSHSNYLAQISIEITQSANQTNDVLTKITILGSILLPMNVITGLFGMNVPVPGGDGEGPYNWFVGICVFLVVFSIASIIFLRKATKL